jgi:hypothetical protein
MSGYGKTAIARIAAVQSSKLAHAAMQSLRCLDDVPEARDAANEKTPDYS